MDKLEIISIYKKTNLEENLEKDTPSSTLLENLSTCNITETINEEILPFPPNNEDIDQILETKNATTGLNFF